MRGSRVGGGGLEKAQNKGFLSNTVDLLYNDNACSKLSLTLK